MPDKPPTGHLSGGPPPRPRPARVRQTFDTYAFACGLLVGAPLGVVTTLICLFPWS